MRDYLAQCVQTVFKENGAEFRGNLGGGGEAASKTRHGVMSGDGSDVNKRPR